jgi:tetratricopeptide (TPR) repeat protein
VTGYTVNDVVKLLGLSAAQVRSFARAGFLTPARGPRGDLRFSFQDLVLLRAAKGLVAARIPARRVRRALRRLRRELPQGRPLSAVRISAQGDRIVVTDGETAWYPESGQVVLDFTVSEIATRAGPLARKQAEAARVEETLTADEWYALGFDLEVTAPDEARDAYRRALELDPHHAEAHINLGRLLHEAGRLEDALGHYRLALQANPDDSTAAFDLAIALEDVGRTGEAIQAYEQAIRSDPKLADAYFNLARLYEISGKRAAALRYLSKYRRLVE